MSLTLARRYNAGIVRLNACPTGTEATGTSVYTLKDYHGNDVGASKIKTQAGIHQTDWQGRQLLYPTARTNLVPDSTDLSIGPDWYNFGGNITSMQGGFADPSGGTDAFGFLVSDAIGALYWFAGAFADGTGVQLEGSIWLRADVPLTGRVATNSTGSGKPVSVGSQWSRYVSHDVFSTVRGIQYGIDQASATGLPSGTRLYAYAPMQTEVGGGSDGAYIPTTSTPVTLTDYTQSGNQVTLGQISDGATLDWTGVIKR